MLYSDYYNLTNLENLLELKVCLCLFVAENLIRMEYWFYGRGKNDNEIVISTNEEIKDLIYTIRGKQVMLDSDVAMLYHCETKYINHVVKRNIDRLNLDIKKYWQFG